MRIRSIKPEFWQSADIAVLPLEDRLLFIGLWSYVDDNGVGRDQPLSVCTSLFAGDFVASPAETLARVTRGLQNLAAHGRITRYTVGGAEFIAVTNWKRHQKIDRPNKPRLPDVDHPEAVMTTVDAADSAPTNRLLASPAETLARVTETLVVRNRGTGEQGNRGTGEQTLSPAADAPSKKIDTEFAEWYATYPRKTARGRALTAYRTARKKTNAETLLAAIAAQRTQLTAKGTEFTPHPATWLNGERWLDEAPTTTPPAADDEWIIPAEPPAWLYEDQRP